MHLEQVASAESPALECAGAEVLHHHVRAGDPVAQPSPVCVAREVGRDAELVAVDGEIVGALATLVERRSPATRLVSLAGALDLEHVGPKIAQQHGAVGSSEDPAQVEHADSV